MGLGYSCRTFVRSTRWHTKKDKVEPSTDATATGCIPVRAITASRISVETRQPPGETAFERHRLDGCVCHCSASSLGVPLLCEQCSWAGGDVSVFCRRDQPDTQDTKSVG